MAFVEKLDVKEIQEFFGENYLGIVGDVKTYDLDLSKILTGWFVKHTFTTNGEFGGHAFLFTDYDVWYVYGGLQTVPTYEARQNAEQKYVEFMTEKFGQEYVDAREAYLAEKRQKEQEAAAIEAKYQKSREKIGGELKTFKVPTRDADCPTQEVHEQVQY